MPWVTNPVTGIDEWFDEQPPALGGDIVVDPTFARRGGPRDVSGQVGGGTLTRRRITYPDPWIGAPSGSVVNTDKGATARVNGAAVIGDVLPIIYGRGRVQGKIWHYVRDGTGGGIFWVWLCCGPIQSVEKVFSNGIDVTSNALWSWDTYLGSATPAAPPGGTLGPPVTGGVVPFPQLFQHTAYLRIYVDPANTLDIGPIEVEVKGKVIPDPRENRIPSCNDFTTGWASNYFGPDLIDVAQNDPFCGTDASLLTFGGTENDWFYNLGALALTAGDYVTVSLYVRVPNGSPDAGFRIEAVNQGSGPGDQEQTFQYVVAQQWWQLIEVTHLCTVDGPLGPSLVISFGFGAYPPAPLLVYCAQIEIKRYRGGRCLTTGSEILPVTQWTRNVALILLDMLRADPDGGAYADDDILIGSFGDVATICGEGNAEDPYIAVGDIRWGLDIVFKDFGELKTALDKARAVAPIDCYLSNDVWRCDIDTKCGDPEIAFSTLRNVISSQLLYETPPAGDSPTNVTLTFADPDNNWKPNSATFPDGETGPRDSAVSLDASASFRQMKQMAAYMQRASACNRFQLGRTTPVTARCHRYQRVTVVDPTRGIPLKTCVIVSYELLDSGEWSANARVTKDEIFDQVDPGTPTGDSTPQPGSVVPPVVQPVCDSSFTISWQAERNYIDRVLHPSSEWSQADVGVWDNTQINDGDTGTVGGDFTPAADSEITLTFPVATAVGGLRITLVANPPVALSGPWDVYADGTPVANSFKRPDNHDVTDSDPGYWHEWDVVTGTAFKLKKGSSTVGTEEITELQYREYLSLYAYSHHVTVHDHATGTPLKTLLTTGAGSLNLEEFAGTSVRSDGAIIKTLDVDLVNYTVKNVASIPVRVVHTEVSASIDVPAKPRCLRVNTDGLAEWLRPIVTKTQTIYGAGFWAAANTSVFTAADIGGSGTGTAWNPNAAGTSELTLDITGAGKVFSALNLVFNGAQDVVSKLSGLFKLRYWDGAAWVDIVSYLGTAGTTVSYTIAAAQHASLNRTDTYVVTATSCRLEFDETLIAGTPEKWQLIQIGSDAIDLPVIHAFWEERERDALVSGYEVWAGFFGITNGAALPLGKGSAPGWVAAGAPSTREYEYTSALFDAGPYVGGDLADRRRANYPVTGGLFYDDLGDPDPASPPPYLAPADPGNTLGDLWEVTVKAVGEGPEYTEGVASVGWLYVQSVQTHTNL